MKKITNIFVLLLLFTVSSNCQVTMIKNIDTDYGLPSKGTYLKDLNNQLSYYIGTWEGIYNNKKYTFKFKVFYQHLIKYNDNVYYYEDELRANFKVVDLATGATLYDNLSTTEYENYKIFLGTLKGGGTFVYIDKSNCSINAKFNLFKVPGTTNQLKFNQFSLRSFGSFDDCPYQNITDIPMFLPTGDFVLTKI